MINPRKLIRIARKWQRVAASRRKRISLPGGNKEANIVAGKGQFVVYTADDQRRFVFPITYLNNGIIRELLRMSEEEFGLPNDRPITLPCDAAFMEYVVSLIQKGVDREMETALIMSMATNRCLLSCSLNRGQMNQQQSLVY